MICNRDVLSLDGKVAVVTGAASGIGLASAEKLAAYGATVAILDINEQLGLKAAEKIIADGGKAKFFKCNVVSEENCKSVAQEIKSDFGRIDILFNNAGVTKRKTVVDLEEKDWDFVIDVCLKGTYLLSKHIIPIMAENGGGSIVNTGSGWGLKGGDDAAAYCAAKGGIVNLTRAMAIDHGKQNIRVNSINPGDTDTPLLRDEGKQLGLEENSFLKDSAKGRPLERLGTPEDIANSVLFFASDLSSWITGAALVVDGGGIA
ncbi:NAD(P)-dependent dehydrogenase, short-chain alcohol dehydrogenase family [Clostridium collagenovorans DSM 3089]|uniref:NAD(P)-dependent dehydrogenase, short-chain alcohol dehydrogenase family n=1 Tax=Clostridium collagenovorans DSM 3089 TaxID=1121306 RepID=A0A1M5W162_9CLOT|nr:SDR family NAD(P)-dependent oxidoreductase [Clostridium collagenovorans]SHH81252.1 NAD(P)-dependent dehydrogenase, short-chain alcohol dehydrogenase family [Clostridium collagenovorans DSM 3089]